MKARTTGVEILNSFLTPRGHKRILEVTFFENQNVRISMTNIAPEGEKGSFESVQMNRREAMALIFYLVRTLLPNKFLTNKWKKKEEIKEEQKND